MKDIRNALASVLVGAFVVVLPFFVFKTIPAENKDIITYMVGQLSGMATMALGYYFTNKVGQDALDQQRAENTGKLADAVTAAANAGTSDNKEIAGKAADDVVDAAADKADQIKGDKP